jgi:hypothetical protein
MSIRILRVKQICGPAGRLPVSKSKFYDDFVLHDPADPFIPGTQIKRTRPVKLAGNAAGFVEGEIDAINEALVSLRDATPLNPTVTSRKRKMRGRAA